MTTTSSVSIDPRARRWGIAVKYIVLLGIGFIVAPFIWVALGGLLGLIAAGVVMGGTWMLLPWLEMKARNLRLKLITGEAARNPVPTLQEELRRQMVALDERKTAIGRLNGQIATFEDKVGDIAAKYGKADPAYLKLAAQLKDLHRVASNRETKWQAAYVQLQRFEQEIERASLVWDAAQAAAAAQESSGLTEADFMAQLKTQTSFDTIRTTFNETLASLDTDLMQSDAEKMVNVTGSAPQAALPASSSTAIDAEVLTSSPVAKVKVAR